MISCLFRFLLLISNLQASNIAAGINVTLPRVLDGALYAVIPSELPFLDVEAILLLTILFVDSNAYYQFMVHSLVDDSLHTNFECLVYPKL